MLEKIHTNCWQDFLKNILQNVCCESDFFQIFLDSRFMRGLDQTEKFYKTEKSAIL